MSLEDTQERRGLERRSTDRELGEIKATLRVFIESQQKDNAGMASQLEKIDDRLRSVEKKSIQSATLISTIVGVGTFIINFILFHFKY